MKTAENGRERIRTALLLAAGTGSRLQPLTGDVPKCLTEVNGTTILERLIRSLVIADIDRLVIVVGHLEDCVRDFVDGLGSGLSIEYVRAEKYRSTNNIYSLWLARQVMQEPFLLVECDLVFEDDLLREMLVPDRMAVSHLLPWMNGTTVTLDPARRVTHFHMDKSQPVDELAYKTVNMYSFSRSSWQRISKKLDQYISAGRVNDYYEMVFAEMVADRDLAFDAVVFDEQRWYEVDTLGDLYEAERLFPTMNGRQMSGAVGE